MPRKLRRGYRFPHFPLYEFLKENYFLEYRKVYKVYECLIASLYMYYSYPVLEEGKKALENVQVLLRVLPNSDKFNVGFSEGGGSLKYFEIASFLSGKKDEWYWQPNNPYLGQFKLPVFDKPGWEEVPGDAILWQVYEQICNEFEVDLEQLKRLENKIRYIYIYRIINNLLDKNHFHIETTLDQLEELGFKNGNIEEVMYETGTENIIN